MTSTTKIPLGVYVGNTDASSATGSAAFEAGYDSFVAAMGTTPTYLDTFLDQTIPISQWVSGAAWQAWSNAQLPDSKNLIPIIALPMASTAAGALSADQTYQAFAAGAYDSVITGMVQAWAAQGFTTQIWRPGWEMNLSSSPWYAGSNAQTQADWVAAFQRISTDLHTAAQQYGVTVQVVWNPDTTNYSNANAIADLYPGNSYVDIIAADDYANVSPYTLYNFGTHAGTTAATLAQWMADPANLEHYWTDPAATQYASDASQGHSLTLDDLLQFAEQEGKPFGVAEAGSGDSNSGHDVADDPAFPEWLSAQLTTAEAAGETIDFVSIWNSNDAGNFQFSQAADDKPLEAAAWRTAFGAATVNSDTTTIATGDVTVSPIPGGTSNVTGDGNDLVTTPSGEASLVRLGAGNDTVSSNGTDTIIGGAGSATVTASANALIFARANLSFTNGSGASTIIGGGATEVLGGAGGVVVYGGPGNDHLVGGSADHNVLVAGAGNATLTGGGNGDLLVAGATGQDSITAAGSTAIFAGGASDTVQGGTGPITTIGGTGSLTITQSATGNAVFAGFGATTINDTSGLDYVIGGAGAVTINQIAAEEVLYIGSGSMVLNAGAGTALIGVFAGAAGGTLTINGYRPSLDLIYSTGYATAPVATTGPAGTTLTYLDGTRIILPGDPS